MAAEQCSLNAGELLPCKALMDAATDERARGLWIQEVFEGGRFKHRWVIYRGGRFKTMGILVNHCPFCGTYIGPHRN